tara:strand:+ start:5156 stop:6085 length:930 start_codon:yes stop_codon:yes gene_type:complete
MEIYFLTFIVSLFFYYSFQKLFIKKNKFDSIKNRSSHSVLATRSGGSAIFFTLFTLTVYLYLIQNPVFDFSILIPLGILFTVGLYDDIYEVDFKLKFIFQIIAAKIIIDSGLIIDNLHGVFGIFELNRIIAHLLTIFIIVAIINAINFIDGVDGLAISVVLLFIGCFEFFSIAETPYIYVSKILAVGLIPLYYFNYRKSNKIFLGDSGSLFLGGIVSIYVIYIMTNSYIIIPKYDLHKFIFIMSVLLYPIIDITRIVIKRIVKGKSPFEADKNHLHHILLSKTKSHLSSTLIIIFSNIIFIVLAQIILN